MQLGPYQLDNNLILAPMAGVTDKPFRGLCRRLGAGLAVSEMVSSDSSLRGTRKTVRRLDFSGETGPVSVQILGSNPDTMAEAARVNVGYGADIIDINMGCPAKKVCKVAAGSALMKDELLVGRILDAVANAVEVPVTLKIRTGWDQESKNAVTIARIAEQSGIQMLAVHGRTRACRFSGMAEYDTIREVKESVTIPVAANGDIDSPQKAREVQELTGCDALMIGRAAQGRPWIFREIVHYLHTGILLPAPTTDWIKQLLLEHVDLLYQLYGEETGTRVARKHIAWYSKSFVGGNRFRALINQSQSAGEQLDLINHFFDHADGEKTMAA